MKQNILRKKLNQIFKKNKLSSSHAKIVSNYLTKFDHKYLITDEHKNYTKKEIIFKIKKYIR